MEISNRLRALRESRCLKQADVSQALGMSRASLSNYENGLTPSIDNAITLAHYYGVTIDYMLGITDDRGNGQGSPIDDQLATLQRLCGMQSITSDDIAALITAAAGYMQRGQVCGTAPIVALRDLLRSAADLLTAAGQDNAALAAAARELSLAAVKLSQLPAEILKGVKK